MDREPPYWVLLSILFSSVPMSESLARNLHRTAYDLYRRDANAGPVESELARGEVTNLRKDMTLGAISGPAFEARLDTERGAGLVRFLLTRSGIELLAAQTPRDMQS